MNTVAQQIKEIMVARGLTLATAESCTSGRIAAALTSVSGASAYFQGGIVAYQDRIKVGMLGVKQESIDQHDVVSQQVVTEMVIGACRTLGADYAIASTGYADGGTDTIPSGTIWIAWGAADDIRTLCLTGDNGREANTQRAADTALSCFAQYIHEL